GTKVSGGYSEATNDFSMVLESSLITFEDFQFHNVYVNQSTIDKDVKMKVDIGEFYLNDTLSVALLLFDAVGSRDTFQTQLTWNPNTTNYSELNWQTAIIDEESIDFLIQPSLISIHEKEWNIKNSSALEYRQDYISIKDFLFERKNQFISLNGKVSDRDEDKLKIKMSHLHLDDFAPIIQSTVALNGELNGFGEISTPFTNLGFKGDASIKGLIIDQEEVGDVFVQSNWEKGKQSIGLKGDLIYKNTQTFAFDGFYHLNRKKDILDFNLVFDDTDIQFTNAFMDPQIVSDIQGTLNGKIRMKGTPDKPLFSGGFDLANGGAKIGILGVKFKTNGEIYCDEHGFYMDNIPIFDQEGNAGALVGSIYHDNFMGWNFDLAFNLEDDAVNKDPIVPWKVLPLDKFLVMNTSYQEGDSYYGKAYMTGYANIFGYAEHLEITVDAKTEKGTTINFPMYGTSEISADEDFITFVSSDSSFVLGDPKINFTGVDLNLNFNVTPDAKLKIIFNEKLGDEIVTDGSGKISMRVDNRGEITLDGTYTVNEGVYKFALGPIKQNFFIEQGGYITWTGDPYNANLNLRSYYKTKANLSEISVDQIGNSTGTNQEVLCYLDITQTLVNPAITFDIEVPNADESGKALINRIKSDPEELNRQFFSLLLVKSFQPLKGSNTAASGTALDLAANQINSMLSQLSQSYKLAVNMDANALGEKTYELGLSKEFLDNRLILSGSFGVENSTATETSSSQNFLIGDVNLEYLLNETGTFRVNIFNESNQSKVIQDNNQGLFKQGIGINYQEDFTGFKNFKLFQYFFDLLRKSNDKRFPYKKNKKRTPVPTID
ncbi:MAG: translocation/assembly module TamB domain-containing protein, partial [Crocinitomicaceae bacterium]|nr:translocation/assembly module TamB domain-containing protein [Crocinitomicaceae bacterium]